MKKQLFALTSMVIFSLSFATAQDADEILETYFETIGQEKLLEAQTIIVKGKMLNMGMELPFLMKRKRPGKAYMEIEIQGAKLIQAYNGENGWMINPMTGSAEPVDLSGTELDQVKEMGDIDGALWDYKNKGHQVELIGTEDMEGSEVYVLKLSKANGDVEQYYIDTENYVALKQKTRIMANNQEVEMETLFSNFQDMDGYIVPMTMETRYGGQVGMTMNMEEVLVDEPIEDAIFSKPGTE